MDIFLALHIIFAVLLFLSLFIRGLNSAIDLALIGDWWILVAYLATIAGAVFALYMKVIRPLL